MIRELSGKLAMKANEASSYSRQLEMAITDARNKEQQLKEKAILKVNQESVFAVIALMNRLKLLSIVEMNQKSTK